MQFLKRYASDSENSKIIVMICVAFVLIIGSSVWWWMTSGRYKTENPGLSELQSRRAIRGCINGQMWAFVEHGKILGEVYGQSGGKFFPMECRQGHEEDGLAMREVCINGKRGAQVLYGQWKNETFLLVSKTRKSGNVDWISQPCASGLPDAETFYR